MIEIEVKKNKIWTDFICTGCSYEKHKLYLDKFGKYNLIEEGDLQRRGTGIIRYKYQPTHENYLEYKLYKYSDSSHMLVITMGKRKRAIKLDVNRKVNVINMEDLLTPYYINVTPWFKICDLYKKEYFKTE